MKKNLFILLAVPAIAWVSNLKNDKPQTAAPSLWLDSIVAVEVPATKKNGVNSWDSDLGKGKYPDLYLCFGKSGIPFTTDTSKDPDKDIRENTQNYPQAWSFKGKNIELKNENWRVWLYDEEGGAGEMMFGSENINPYTLKSPVELVANTVHGSQPGFKLRVYFSKK